MSAIAHLCKGLTISPTQENTSVASQEHALTQLEATTRYKTDEWILEAAQVEPNPSLGLLSHDYFGMAPSEALTAAQVGVEGLAADHIIAYKARTVNTKVRTFFRNNPEAYDELKTEWISMPESADNPEK